MTNNTSQRRPPSPTGALSRSRSVSDSHRIWTFRAFLVRISPQKWLKVVGSTGPTGRTMHDPDTAMHNHTSLMQEKEVYHASIPLLLRLLRGAILREFSRTEILQS